MSRRERPEVEQRVIPAGAPDDPERFKSPRRGMAAAVLVLEGIILGLTAPVLVRFTDISTGVAVGIGVGLGLACVLTSGLLRKEWGYGVGWALQVAALALGFLVPAMFFLGAIFAALWATADLMGRTIERERGEAWAAYDASHPAEAAAPAAPSED